MTAVNPPPSLSPEALWAIGLTLLDLKEGRGTLWGGLVRHDSDGNRLDPPRPEFSTGWVLQRPGLPDGWAMWCWQRGMLRLVSGSVSPYWLPTPEALDLARKWIADAGPFAGLPDAYPDANDDETEAS